MNPFNVEHQYQAYLQRVGLSETVMHPEQKIQLRQAFFGAWGQLLDLMHNDIAELPEQGAIVALESMESQVRAFWGVEVKEFLSNPDNLLFYLKKVVGQTLTYSSESDTPVCVIQNYQTEGAKRMDPSRFDGQILAYEGSPLQERWIQLRNTVDLVDWYELRTPTIDEQTQADTEIKYLFFVLYPAQNKGIGIQCIAIET